MAEEKLDPRIVRTKEAIQTVFKQMVCEMPYEKITVKAITQAARINRNTFSRLSIPANTARLFRELISSRKPENLFGPFLNTWKLRMIFSSELPATAVLTISAKECRTGLQNRLRNLVRLKVWTKACATSF